MAAVVVQAVTTTIPPDGQCVHVMATRLSDFTVSEFVGPLEGAILVAHVGEQRITATAFATPCTSEPTSPPWTADPQIATFAASGSSVTLAFHATADVGIGATFDDSGPAIAVHDETRIEAGRSGEDAAAGGYILDGWDVQKIPLPPAAGPATTIFTTLGKTTMTMSPRGLAVTPGGLLVFQGSDEYDQPVWVFDAAGNFIESWPILRGPGVQLLSNTDGLEAIDDGHFVRTNWLAACAADPCNQTAIEIMDKVPFGSGSALLVSTQIFLPEPYNQEYPVGVGSLGGGRFAVATLPDSFGGNTRLLVIDSGGAVVAGPTTVTGDVEGLFVDGTRLMVVNYEGDLTDYDPTTLAPLGDTASHRIGVDIANGFGIAWEEASGGYIDIDTNSEVRRVNAAFDHADDLGFNANPTGRLSGFDLRQDAHQLLTVVRGGSNVIQSFDLATGIAAAPVTLQGLPAVARARTMAFVGPTLQTVTHFRQVGGIADATLDPIAFVHDLDGTLARTIDLHASAHVSRILAIRFRANSDELLFRVLDDFGVDRLLVTDTSGTPHRSYRSDAVPGLFSLAPISTGPNAGDVGILTAQPSFFERVSLP